MLLLSGNMEVTEANVGFKIAGRVTELSVDEGHRCGRVRFWRALTMPSLQVS